MKIEQNLAKNENQLQKSPPRQIFDDFGLILRCLGEPKSTKNQEKSKPKKQSNPKSQKKKKKNGKKL